MLDLRLAQAFIGISKLLKRGQLFFSDVVLVFLSKQKLINPIATTLGKDDRAVTIFIEAFFLDASAQIIGLSVHYLLHRLAESSICDRCLLCSSSKGLRFEYPHWHKLSL